ncbi:hypothetical protein E05_40300 [Plautia stali symbiont]|nr:hypothetical protein E05_40300 [Plautia stali symbiont]
MNQAIQFPDRESWDAVRQAVLFPVLVNGMGLTCAISLLALQQRFGAGEAMALFSASLGSGGRGGAAAPGGTGRRSGLAVAALSQVFIFPANIIAGRIKQFGYFRLA